MPSTKLLRTYTIIGAFFLVALFWAGPALGRVYLDITATELRKVPMAVPYFIDKTASSNPLPAGKEMADIMSRGLSFHGFIKVEPPDRYQGRQDSDWQGLGVDFTVLGQYKITANDIVLELRLINLAEGRMLLGRRYRGKISKNREMILKFCDEIILSLTGQRGISRTQISFVSDQSGKKEIYLADVLGDNIRQVTHHHDLAVSPRFSPNGKRLAYTSYHHGNADLYITNLTQKLTTRPISRRKGLNMAPAWAPDGKSMVLTLSKDGSPDLYQINTRGVILRRITANAGINVSPNWSPDGKQLAFVSDRSGKPQIYVMEMKNKHVRRLTYEGIYNTSPSWSPQGDKIAYTGDYQGNYNIFMISPQGGPSTRITRSWGSHEAPSWSPDGNQLVYTRTRNDEKKICAIFKNGKWMRELFKMNGNQSFPQWSPEPSK